MNTSLLAKLPRVLATQTRARLWPLLRYFASEVTLSTRQGRYCVSTFDDGIARQLFVSRQYELEMMTAAFYLLRYLQHLPARAQGCIVDVGANIGTTGIGALVTGEFERAIMIEPSPENFLRLRQNVVLNGLGERTMLINAAASDDGCGGVQLELSPDKHGDNRVRISDAPGAFSEQARQIVTVDAITLDNALAPYGNFAPSLIWIDTQGYDYHIMAGARGLLDSGVPVVFEFWPYGLQRVGIGSPYPFKELFNELSFTPYVWRNRQWDALDSFGALWRELVAGTGHVNIMGTP